MADAVGPVYAGRFEEFVVKEDGENYTILYLADRNNDALQAEGKPPVYYWVPGEVRLARHGDTGPFKFRHLHFVGALNEDIHIGVEGETEVVGGLMALSTTSRYPTSVLKQANDQLIAKFRGDDDRYWGWRTSATPRTAMAPITSNITAITNLTPGSDGTAPAERIGEVPVPAPAGASAPPGRALRSLVRRAAIPDRVTHGQTFSRSSLDAWAFQVQGQGPGSVTGGENAYSGLMGAYPSELIWAGFHGGFSPMVVSQNLILPVWSQEVYLKITGKWSQIFSHFSGHLNARYLWASADIKAEFNKLRTDGAIEVTLAVDGTTPQGADAERAIESRIDLIVDQFTKQATQVIFEAPVPDVKPAKAPSGGFLSSVFGGGGGLALKARRDERHLDLSYEETRYFRYNQPTTISSSLQGFAEEIEADPSAEDRYFQRVVMGDLSKKVTTIVKPVVNFPDPARNWVGQPVSFMSAQIGYPDAHGSIDWAQEIFQSTDTAELSSWEPAFAKRDADAVANAPDGWEPQKMFMRRKVHMQEPPGSFDNPFVHLSIEQNEVELDDGEHGTLTEDRIVEVRADRVGVLEVGPINLGVILEDATQQIEVTFYPAGQTADGADRAAARFLWSHANQDEPRYLKIYTGDKDYVPAYEYQVRVIVRGSLFTAGMEWSGERLQGQGNGPFMVTVPTTDSVPPDRVIRRSPLALAAAQPAHGNGSEGSTSPNGGNRPPGVRAAAKTVKDATADAPLGNSGEYEASVGGFELGNLSDPEVRSTRTMATRTEGDDGDEDDPHALELLPGWKRG